MNNKSGWFYRARRTFIQVAVGSLVGTLPALFTDDVPVTWNALVGVIITAIATGIAAVMNLNDGKEVSADTSENNTVEENHENTQLHEQQETPDTTDNEPFVEESAGEG